MNKIRRIFIVLLTAFILLGINEESAAWDSTAAKYYPLAVGNKWVYLANHFSHFNCVPVSNFYVTRTVVSKDLLSNGKWYFKIVDSRGSGYGWYRIDSNSMNLYSNVGSATECLIDSLLAGFNDIFNGCYIYYAMSDTTSQLFAGELRKSRKVEPLSSPRHERYIDGFGIFYELQCAPDGYDMTLKGCIINGVLYGDTSTLVGINQIGTEIPEKFSLSQNYPNPFNPVTHFEFRIAESGLVRLTVFDLLGKEVEILVNKELRPGSYEADWDATAYPSGVYYYELESGSFTETKKMVLIK